MSTLPKLLVTAVFLLLNLSAYAHTTAIYDAPFTSYIVSVQDSISIRYTLTASQSLYCYSNHDDLNIPITWKQHQHKRIRTLPLLLTQDEADPLGTVTIYNNKEDKYLLVSCIYK